MLAAMNRGPYARRLSPQRRQATQFRPDLALSSDFIAGAPGETDKDFAETIALVEEIGFAQAFTFKYSPRPGTPAAMMANQVPEDVKNERLYVLQHLIDKQLSAFNAACVGRTFDVLLTSHGRLPRSIGGPQPVFTAGTCDGG